MPWPVQRRTGKFHCLGCVSLKSKLTAYQYPSRSAVRYSASLLGKQVDSLSPSITAMVVRDKEVGSFSDGFSCKLCVSIFFTTFDLCF